MKLKRLELVGFKSFMNPTVVTFTEGITAVVGPNGCGKSNIVDATRWAMGEMSAKHLRGKIMEDVIFNGSMELPPLGMAEVTLTFDNSDGKAPPEYAGFTEIEVTRRLFRSGESEYLINRTPCRLKDINELFLGTGVGRKAYSVVEQGQIEQIISSKPEDRRGLIEEAAGISKYRSRKAEAERKMEATRQNLLRARDIIAEIRRQMNSLNRQAKKAERYKMYRDELKEIDLEHYTLQSLEIMQKLESAERDRKEKQELSEEILARIEFAEAQLEAQKIEKMELEARLRSAQDRMYEIQSNIQSRENKLKYHEQEIESERRLSARLKNEVEELTARIQEAEAEIIRTEYDKTRIEAEASKAVESEAEAEALRLKLLEDKKRIEADIESRQRRSTEIKEETARLQSNLENFQKQEKELAGVISENLARVQDLEAEQDRIHRASFKYNERLYELRKLMEEISAESRSASEELEGLRRNLSASEAREDEIRGQYDRGFSRLESLLEMQVRYEGFERGVKSIMEKRDRDQQAGKNGIYGLVADVLETQPEYETALEAVLGERLQSVIVSSQSQGIEAIQYLRDESAGRGTFIPLEPRLTEAQPMPQDLAAAGAKPLLDLVEVEPEYRPVAQYLLSEAVLVPSLDKAVELWEANGHKYTMVTPDGAVLEPHGVLAGGSKDSYGIMEKKREARELTEDVKELKKRLDAANTEVRDLKERVGTRGDDLDRLREREHSHELDILNHEKDLKASIYESNQLVQRFEELRNQAKQSEEQISEIQGLARSIEEMIKEKAAQEEVNASELVRLTSELESVTARLAEAEEASTERKVLAAAQKEKLSALSENHARLMKEHEDLRQGIQNREREISAGENDLRNLQELIEQTRAELHEELKAREEFETVLQGERELYEKAREALNSSESSLAELRQKEDTTRKELNDLQLAVSELKLQSEHILESVRDRYYMELEQVIPMCRERVQAPDYAAEERRTRRDELRGLLERMGEVNVTAIEEYKELEERYSFLTTQEADLLQALESLEKTIEKINRNYRREFRQTFEAVNEQFTKVFPRIFRGGKAMLVLTNEHDLLDTGVEIIAQPPGKKLQSITLLSGGEKSLAAVSLIIALFLHRPSPFCLLDEVDAALDDVNIDRFNEMVQELSKNSQFIVITHNKRTMQIADTLYGVTMEQAGVSKLISVKLN